MTGGNNMKIKVFSISLMLLAALTSCASGKNSSEKAASNKETVASADMTTALSSEADAINHKDKGNSFEANEEDFLNAVLEGSTELIPYEDIIAMPGFERAFKDFKSTAKSQGINVEGCYVSKPFRAAVVSTKGDVKPINVVQFPIVSKGRYVGTIFADCRKRREDKIYIDPQIGYRDSLKKALENGSFAIFDSYEQDSSSFIVYEDGTFASLDSDVQYTGPLTYKDIAQEYNIITPEDIDQCVYPTEAES
jgi:hypothetical protein